MSGFQSTLPRGERHCLLFISSGLSCFNPRSRVGSDRYSPTSLAYCSLFQSTLPRGERQAGEITHSLRSRVSIHAPAWGATRCCHWSSPTLRVSIHAPAWGATYRVVVFVYSIYVSIHAPAWGATPGHYLPPQHHGGFNPRSRVGSDRRRTLRAAARWVSIHAPAWGATVEDLTKRLNLIVSIHAPAWGATKSDDHKRPFFRVSIHAPAWGATSI